MRNIKFHLSVLLDACIAYRCITVNGAYSLALYDCYRVKDVSSLGHIAKLTLNHCHDLFDVSALGGVEELICLGVIRSEM